MSESGFVTLKVYDLVVNGISTLENQEKPSGIYKVQFDAFKLSSGAYLYQMSVGSFIQTKNMLLIK